MSEKNKHQEMIAYFEEVNKNNIVSAMGIQIQYDPIEVSIEVDHRLFQPMGVVHGGVYVVLAETAASIAAAFEVDIPNEMVMGMEINANHLRPITSGTLKAIPELLHKGSTTLVYNVVVWNELGKKVCVSRCTIARRKLGGE